MYKSGGIPGESKEFSEAAWYCLQAKYKQEHIAAAHLRELKGVTVFCPRIRFRRQTRLRVIWVTEALFPGYLFARFDLTRMHRVVGYAHGVKCIVRFANRYPTIDGPLIDRLREEIGGKEIKLVDYEPLEGDSVKVADGAFAGLEAVVMQNLPARARVRVLLDFLGRKVEAELERSSVLRSEARSKDSL
ncbi:MAG: transcription termination/antitermination NusG family protein [Chthoniobacterales bacterium]